MDDVWRVCDWTQQPHKGHVDGECRNPRPYTPPRQEALVDAGWTPPPTAPTQETLPL